MRVVRHLDHAPRPFRDPVVTLGNFDGIHRGHARILERTVERARAIGGDAVAFTFWPHPTAVLAPDRAPASITSVARRLEILRDAGLTGVVLRRFTRAFASIEPREFVERILIEQLGAREVVVGHDVNFGRNRGGTPALLVEEGRRLGFDVEVIAPVMLDEFRVSSSLVRERLAAGEVDVAARLLGRAHELRGRVREGDRRGRTIGFPTANLFPRGGMLPPDGVYAVRIGVGDEPPRRPAVANLGCNPTFGIVRRRLEAHLFDYSGDLYGRVLRVALVARIREERRFASLDALVAQIRADAETARRLLAAAP